MVLKEKEKEDQLLCIQECLNSTTNTKNNTNIHITDLSIIYSILGDDCYTLLPMPASHSPDSIFYLGKSKFIIGIQNKSYNDIDTKTIVSEARKFSKVDSYNRILLIIGFCKFANIPKHAKKNCKDYKILETNTIMFSKGSTLSIDINSTEYKININRFKEIENEISTINNNIKKISVKNNKPYKKNLGLKNTLNQQLQKKQIQLNLQNDYLESNFVVPDDLEIYVLSDNDLKLFFSDIVSKKL